MMKSVFLLGALLVEEEREGCIKRSLLFEMAILICNMNI